MSLSFVRTVREFDSLESTSDTARELVVDGGIELPLLVLAHAQTAGRGRGDHAWWSGEGSLTFTVAIDPEAHGLRPEHEPRVALAVAVALCWVIEDFADVSPQIRWPNDVELHGRKLAGILPERVETPEGPRLLIGIGLNVRNHFDDAPEHIRAMATSIDREWRGDVEPAEISEYLEDLLAVMSTLLAQLAAEDAGLGDAWRHRDALLNWYVRLKTDDAIITGIGVGIAPDGGLRIRSVGQEAKVYYGGRVLRD